MSKIWRYGIGTILFFAMTFLIIFYHDLLYTNLITPIAQVLWPIIRILKVIDQKTLWGLLIVAATILSIWLISKEKEEDYSSTYYETSYLDDPILKWEGLIRRAQNNMDERIILKNKLECLSNSIGTCLNESICTEVNLNVVTPHFRNLAKNIVNLFSNITKNRFTRNDADFESQINKILASMEIQMEIYHDDES